jgi:hypothetical protein
MNRALDVGVTRARVPHHPLIGDDGRGHRRDVGLNAQGIEISLEQSEVEVLGGRIRRRRNGHKDRKERNSE